MIPTSLNAVAADSTFGKILRFALNRIPKSHVANVRGGVNQGAKWVVGTSIHRCWLGSYETDKQKLIQQIIKPGMVVWDVGANAGFYTLAFSRLTGREGIVYSFEPLGSNMENLRRHIKLNGLTNTRVVQCGLSDKEGLTGFDTSISHQKGFLSDSCDSYLVPTITADGFLAQRPEAVPDVLKIDIEGAESAMLEGARQLLITHRPLLLLALHGADQVKKCYQILEEVGYKVVERSVDEAMCGEEILAEPLPVTSGIVSLQPAAA